MTRYAITGYAMTGYAMTPYSITRSWITLSLLALTIAALPAFAQDADTPATEPAATVETTDATEAAPEATGRMVRVTATKGLVMAREDETSKWQRVKIGMELGEGAEFRTGPRSFVRFVITPDDHEVTVDRLGVVKVLKAIEEDGVLKTDLGMKYGRTKFKVEAGGLEHESTIRAPGTTLAVRGSEVVFGSDKLFGNFVHVVESIDAVLEDRTKGRFISIRRGVSKDGKNPGETSRDTFVDPRLEGARDEDGTVRLRDIQFADFDSAIFEGRDLQVVQLVNVTDGLGIPPGGFFGQVDVAGDSVTVLVFDAGFTIDGDRVGVLLNQEQVADVFLKAKASGDIIQVSNLRDGANFLTFKGLDAIDNRIAVGVEAPTPSGETFTTFLRPGDQNSLILNRTNSATEPPEVQQ